MPRLLVAEMVRAGARQKAPRDAYTSLMGARAELLREQPFDDALRRAMTRVEPGTHPWILRTPRRMPWPPICSCISDLVAVLGPAIARPMARASVHASAPSAGNSENATVLTMCSEVALICASDIDQALALSEAAVRHDANDAQALALLGHIRRMAGDDPRGSLAFIEHAQRLSPRDPRTFLWLLYGRLVPLEAW